MNTLVASDQGRTIEDPWTAGSTRKLTRISLQELEVSLVFEYVVSRTCRIKQRGKQLSYRIKKTYTTKILP